MSTMIAVSSESDEIASELLGPFRCLIKMTLLDCSAKSKCISIFTQLVAIIIVVLLFARVGLLMETDGNSLSFAWAESNFFGFPAIQAAVCALCLLGWTRNKFVPRFAKKLAHVRMLRLNSNDKMDNYRMVQVLALLFSLPWGFALMSWIVYNLMDQKILNGGAKSNMIFCILITISNFYIWIISSISLAIYVIVHSALTREVVHFNEELKKAKKEKSLQNLGTLEKFDFRQNEILSLILQANGSLSSFTFSVLFMFYGLVNGVYLTGFMSSCPFLFFVFLCINLAAIIIYNLITLSPPCGLQEQLEKTSRILINDDEFESSKDPIVYQTYRIMVDRLQKVDTRIYVISSIPIIKRTLAAALFIVPNLGMLLLMVKKVIIGNGGHV